MENVKTILGFLVDAGKAVEMAKKNDGKFDLSDLALLIGPMTQVPAVMGAVKLAGDEFKAADSVAKAELVAWFNAKLDLADKKNEAHIEAVIQALVSLSVFFKD